MDIDEESRKEVMDAFQDLYEEIEGSIGRLMGDPSDAELHALFRAVHSIKGNASMLQVRTIVDFTHALEEVAQSLRAHRYPATTLICESLHLGMDRIRDLHLRDIMGQAIENFDETVITPLFTALAEAEPQATDQAAKAILNALGAGFAVAAEEEATTAESPEVATSEPVDLPVAALSDGQRAEDLRFFEQLAHQVDKQNQYWEGRCSQVFEWAHKMNQLAGSPCDTDQFSAAIYLHDIGMSFVPSRILNKETRLTPEEIAEIRRHPEWGYQMLTRMPGWDDAARIVLEHQEHYNGQGYPAGLAGEDIHPGARILAVLDAFFSITNGRADRTQRKSVVRAISELNARSGSQFDPNWVQTFNDMIKGEIRAGKL